MVRRCAIAQLILVCSTFHLVHEVDSFGIGAAAIGVVSGALGIYEFIRSTWERFNTRLDKGEYPVEKESDELKAQFLADLRSFREEIRFIDEKNAFLDSLNEIGSAFVKILDNFNFILEKKKILDNDTDITPQAQDDYIQTAREMINYHVHHDPLNVVHSTIRGTKKIVVNSASEFIGQYEKFYNVCATRVSPIQAINRLLGHVIWMSSYVFNTLAMSYYIRDGVQFGGLDNELVKSAAKSISESYLQTIDIIGPRLKQVSRKLYQCNLPNTTVEESSYELRTFQKLYVRKCHIASMPASDKKCSSINKSERCTGLNDQQICAIFQPCAGPMHECEDVNDLAVCTTVGISFDKLRKNLIFMIKIPRCVGNALFFRVKINSNPQNTPEKGSRYEYYYNPSIESAPKGNYSSCSVQNLKEGLPRQRVPLLFFNTHSEGLRMCNSCQCVCEERNYWISTSPSYSNIQDNKVVTGAKFVLEDNILEVHIQQGKLEENGTIDPDSLEWVAPPHEIDGLVKISWNKVRSIDLSTRILKPGNVITGLRPAVRKISTHEKIDGLQALYLQVLSSPYDLRRGLILEKKYDDPTKDAAPEVGKLTPENELNLTNAEVPSRQQNDESKVIMKDDGFVKLTTSNGKDGGQSTIPFFDGQEVTSLIPTPLSGAGLYWKGKNESGGFIGIILHTYDIAPFITNAADAQ
ncbi:hypothetical protein QAD02_005641 [Eretmocerus hayati]|uniref:Uncharacterized protein n=1 Tax=Eretmocerus hayati TaxID=131215 RepID=A0ACC2NT03_9HYME|nr:hypothetical protein QAD02_005641 [Eretmocerus hayati]